MEKAKRTQEEIDKEKAELAKTIRETTEAASRLSSMKEKSQGSKPETVKAEVKEPTPTQVASPEKTEEEIKNEIKYKIEIEDARKEYFKLKNDKSRGKDLGLSEEKYLLKVGDAEEAYKNAKNGIVKEFLNKGEKEKAQEFLFSEVEIKRKNNLENKLVGRGERLKAGISKGIEKWDNFGNEKGWKGYAKKLFKTGISLGLIGVTSVGSVEGLAKIGIGSATALSTGATSYLGRRMASGLLIGGVIMEKVPDKYKKWVSGLLLAGSAGFAISGGAYITAAAVGVGYGLSNLTKMYNKRIKGRMENLKNELDLSKIETDSKKIEEEIEQALKRAETTRIVGKILEGATAIVGSMAVIEASGITQDIHQAKIETEHKVEELKQAELKHQEDLKHEADLKAQHEAEIKAETELLKDATIHKGEGIENAFIRQIEHNHDLAEELGFKGNINDANALREFAEHEAHVLAIKEGYVDNAGHEVWVKEGNKVAYEIKIEHSLHHGNHVVVEEKTVSGENIATHHEGDKFGVGDKEKAYEYNDGRDHRIDSAFEKQSHEEATAELKALAETKLHNTEPVRTEYIDTSKRELKTEYVDTSKPPMAPFEHKEPVMTPFEHKETPMTPFTHDGHTYTEAEWAKAPENIYHIPLKDFVQVNELHNSNIDHIINGQHLAGKDVDNVREMVKEGEASAMVGMKEVDVKDIHHGLWQYENKLHEVTGLEPRSATPLHPAETNEQYIYRAEMKAAEMHKLDDVKLENIDTVNHGIQEQHITSGSEIIIPNNGHFPLITQPFKVHFSYDAHGNVSTTVVSIDTVKMEGFRDNVLFKNDFRGEIYDKCKLENRMDELSINTDAAFSDEVNLYTYIAAYDGIKEDMTYIKESEFLKNMISEEIKTMSKEYGNIIDFEKLPKEFQK